MSWPSEEQLAALAWNNNHTNEEQRMTIPTETEKTDAIEKMYSGMATTAPPAPRLFFCNLEEALAADRLKSQRHEARAFMPIRDQVLVYVCDKDETTETGAILIPESAQERQSEGIAIAVGRGKLDANNVFIPTEVRPGDRVLFGKYAGTEYKLRGKTVRLMQEEEVLGVIR